MDTQIKISSWNMRGFGTGKAYLHELINQSDIICIQEHWLYESECYQLAMLEEKYDVTYKTSNNLNNSQCGMVIGQGGVAILYSPTIPNVTQIHSESDRICGINIHTKDRTLSIINAYLPQAGCYIASFDETLSHLDEIVQNLK